ncbi:MAG: OmpA family protein [Methylobacter sp.]|uniref:OmpA family protein n=1 Tax=Methylobacter sp. TaxID=2051955 RepID=UPI00272FF756|nr:OmpA family protein [Methylobacter sp.]MDP1667370.1 OmpA family protein [Methylobacter sp.]
MQNNRYFPMTLIAAAIASGCSSMPNQLLTEAHSHYDSARTNPEVTNLAALELKDAGDTLNKADAALNKDESDDAVNQLAYIATQQVGIAQQVAKRKTAELAVTNAGAQRDATRLEARTAEADAAHALIAQQAMELQALNAKKTERGMVITLNDVLFSTNKSQLASGGIRNVQKLADFLTQYPQQKVLVEGYTDSIGSDSFNQELSDRRAYAVRTALTDMAISSDRIAARGYGEAFPVAGNETAASRQLNRRVEIILSDENGNIVPR